MAKSGDLSFAFISTSTNGRPVAVAATSSPGTDIHVAPAGTTTVDLLYLEVTNTDTVSRTVTLQWGGTGAADQVGPVSLSANAGPALIASGRAINNGLTVKAYSDSANKINITGRVSRLTL